MSSSSAFDDLDWASAAAASPSSAARNINPAASSSISEEFLDDFDDDDDAFFSSATVTIAGESGPGAIDSIVEGANKSQSSLPSFAMMVLTYYDGAFKSTTTRGGRHSRPTSPTFGQYDAGVSLAQDVISDDAELMELDRSHLAPLRNPSSLHCAVARSCLMLHQLIYFADQSASIASSATTSHIQIQIQSSSIHDRQRHQRFTHRIISSLAICLSSHSMPSCRSLASKTLASTARASYAGMRFDARLASMSAPPPIATRTDDECCNGAAYSLVVAAIEEGDDGVSSAALEALGRLTLDPRTDNLAAEVRGIAECADSDVFMYKNDCESYWILEHSHAMREMQSKAWEHVVFPRMHHILHRISLYNSMHLLAKAIPVLTAAFVHALTQGRDTMPSRRAFQTSKESHGKRGWREVDAEGLAREYVEGILLPCFNDRGAFNVNVCSEALQRAVAAACIRMSSASPHALWRLSACRHATAVLLQQLNREIATASSSHQVSWKYPTKPQTTYLIGTQEEPSSPISSTISSASVPVETLAGTAALLAVALRGVPLYERAPGLAAVLRATLLFLPLGVPLSSGTASLDLPIGTVQGDGPISHYRLGRVGLLAEVALSVMFDGASNTNYVKVDESGSENNGTRPVLLQRILESDQLAVVWEGSKNRRRSTLCPMDELIWVICTVITHNWNRHEQLFVKDSSAAVEWPNLGLGVLDLFARIISSPIHWGRSPFAEASHAAYNGLFAAVLDSCGSFPPPALSISENMLPNNIVTPSVDKASSVVHGPGKQSHHVASTLSKIATKILYSREKSKYTMSQMGGAPIEATSNSVQLAALIVDTWLGRCIMNHDAKQSNVGQLDLGIMFLPLCQSEVEALLQKKRSIEVAHFCRVLIASVEHIAFMSELLMNVSSKEHGGGVATAEKQVGPLAISMLNGIITSTKQGASTDTEQGSILRHQIALDAKNAISRITECIHNKPYSNPDDVLNAFQVSPLVASVMPQPTSASPLHREPKELCALFLYNHARLAVIRLTESATKMFAPTIHSSSVFSSSKLIKHHNALRIQSAFSHSIIETYQKVPEAPLLILARPSMKSSWDTETLTGSSDPVSLLFSHGIRRVRKSDSSEGAVIVATMRLYNSTTVPIRNGVRLGLKVAQRILPNNKSYDNGSTCVATTAYKHEINAGDSITWEIILRNCMVSTLSLQSSVTFQELEHESSTHTHEWLSVEGPEDNQLLSSEAMDYQDESILDVTLPCRSITLSPITSLTPCPLVFFGMLSRSESNLGSGDAASFQLLWDSMGKCERKLGITIINTEMERATVKTFADTNMGYVVLSQSSEEGTVDSSNFVTGWALMAPNGSRIFCTHQMKGELNIRSDLPHLFESLVGTQSLQTSFLEFIFGKNSFRFDDQGEKIPVSKQDIGNDFTSMAMRSGIGWDFPSRTNK